MKRLLGIIFLSVLFMSCGIRGITSETRPHSFSRVGFFGFLVPVWSPQGEVLVKEALGGTHHLAEYVPAETREEMETMVWEELQKRTSMELLSPDQLRAGIAIESLRDYQKQPLEHLVELGRRSSLEAILVGHIYRYREREGSDYAVSSPASVSFDLYLIDVEKGAIVARHTVDITQRSLSENLLGLKDLRAAGLRWARAKELAKTGIAKALDQILGPGLKE